MQEVTGLYVIAAWLRQILAMYLPGQQWVDL